MKVLVIDDEELIRRALVRVAQSFQCEVKEAEDGKKGQTLWLCFQPDLVFLDVLMPEKTGPELIEAMSQKHSSTIALMSALTQDYNNKKALTLGAHLFIPKPFDDIFHTFKKAQSFALKKEKKKTNKERKST